MIRAPPSALLDGRSRQMVSPNCNAFEEPGLFAPVDAAGLVAAGLYLTRLAGAEDAIDLAGRDLTNSSGMMSRMPCSCVQVKRQMANGKIELKPVIYIPYCWLILAVDETSQDLLLLLQRRILFVQATNHQNAHRVDGD